MVTPARIPLMRTLVSPHLLLRSRPGTRWISSPFCRTSQRKDVSKSKALLNVVSSRTYSQIVPSLSMASGGLFHEAALRGDVDEFRKLFESGVDVNSPDSAGRLPLHLFCGASWMDDEFLLDDQVPRPGAEWLLRHTRDIDTPDRDGITALHIASMMSQYLVKLLLGAGADLTCTTCDGMSALHLAARARQSNIVGMLLDALSGYQEEKQDLINAKDDAARTPLHYACRSGRPETVFYLLAAGADPTSLDYDGMSPLDACLEFEEEQALWADFRELELPDWYWLSHTDLQSDWGAHALGGVRRQDQNRPWVRPGRVLQHALDQLHGGPWREDKFRICSVQHTTRLGEVLRYITKALFDRGKGAQAVQDHIVKCINHCERKGLDYTKACLLELQNDLNADPGSPACSDYDVTECLQRSQADLHERYGTRHDQPNDHVHLALVDMLLRRREYSVLKRVLRHDGPFLPLSEADVCNIARLLAKNGFADLLETLIDSKYGRQIRSETSAPSKPADPLLIVAVKRQLPNMDVVRLLTKKARVDINSISRNAEDAYADVAAPGVYYEIEVRQPGHNTALHECAKGFNWWQVKHCLPYLLSEGADPHLKNEAGATPFEITQADYKETFMDDAAKLLKDM